MRWPFHWFPDLMIDSHPHSSTTKRFLSESLIEKEYKLAIKYNSAGGGPKMLLGDTANQMKDLPSTLLEYRALASTAPTSNSPKGRIGEVYPNFATANQEARYTQFKWYGQMIYAPVNSREILHAQYGINCLTHSIDKYHSNVESEIK